MSDTVEVSIDSNHDNDIAAPAADEKPLDLAQFQSQLIAAEIVQTTCESRWLFVCFFVGLTRVLCVVDADARACVVCCLQYAVARVVAFAAPSSPRTAVRSRRTRSKSTRACRATASSDATQNFSKSTTYVVLVRRRCRRCCLLFLSRRARWVSSVFACRFFVVPLVVRSA